MPKTLPDCPSCDAADTLTVDEIEPRGVRVCRCWCCSKRCRVNIDSEIVHVERKTDVSGHVIHDDP